MIKKDNLDYICETFLSHYDKMGLYIEDYERPEDKVLKLLLASLPDDVIAYIRQGREMFNNDKIIDAAVASFVYNYEPSITIKDRLRTAIACALKAAIDHFADISNKLTETDSE